MSDAELERERAPALLRAGRGRMPEVAADAEAMAAQQGALSAPQVKALAGIVAEQARLIRHLLTALGAE